MAGSSLAVLVIAIIFASISVIFYINIKPSVIEGDISVEGVLELNNTGDKDYKEYVLNIEMVKDKDCNIAVYPYIAGLGQISFSDQDRDDYFVPGSIGSDGVTEPIAINQLKK